MEKVDRKNMCNSSESLKVEEERGMDPGRIKKERDTIEKNLQEIIMSINKGLTPETILTYSQELI